MTSTQSPHPPDQSQPQSHLLSPKEEEPNPSSHHLPDDYCQRVDLALHGDKANGLNDSKYQSPIRSFPPKECCSPSFFFDFANGKPILSPLSETIPSQVGSTYTEKHLRFGRQNEERVAISSFDTNVTSIEASGGDKVSPEEGSDIRCKFETEEESKEKDKRKNEEEREEQQFRRTRARRTKYNMESNGRKQIEEESKKSEKATKKSKGRRSQKMEVEAKAEVNEEKQAMKTLDTLIENLSKKLNETEQVKQETMVEESTAMGYGIQIACNNFLFESDTEEKKELLTEEESLFVLKEMCKNVRPGIHFLSTLSGSPEIKDTVLIDEEGLRQNGAQGLRFLRTEERTRGRMLSIPDQIDELPSQLAKKISKLANDDCYRCKYCGKLFQKGCALGGHISRIHKGESLTFRMRQETRKKRVADRTRGKFLRKESVKQLENTEDL